MSNSTRKAWNELYRRGYSLLPADPQTKRPLVAWAQYQKQRATVEIVRGWLAQWPAANPGVITGRVSNIIVLDQDGLQGAHSLVKIGVVPTTPKVRTARGAHYYFVYPTLDEKQRVMTKAGIAPNLDIRGDGGYVVGPGSIHHTGIIYEWELSPEDAPFAQAPDWLLDLVVTSEPDPHDVKPLYVPPPVIQEGNDRARAYALAALVGEADKVTNAADGEKHDRLLRSAIAVAGFIPLISEQEIEQALYDAVASRAADKRAARITIRDGIDYGSRRPREIPEGNRDNWTPPIGFEMPSAPEQPQAQDEPAVEAPPQRHRWEPRAIGDLRVTEEQLRWIWQGYLAPGMQTLFTGLWKSGKSTMLAHLLAALGGNASTFAGLPVQQTKVLVVSEEGERQWVQRRDELQISNMVHIITKPFLGNASDSEWGALLQYCAQQIAMNEYGLVIFDSLPNLWSVRNENDNAEVKRAVVGMNQLTEAGAAVLMAAHPAKIDTTVGKSTRGASQLMTMVDVLVEFRRMSESDLSDTRRVLSALGRFDETPPELVLQFMPGYGYDVLGSKAQAAQQARKAILWDILPLAAPGWTVADILADWPDSAAKPAKHTLAADLRWLSSDGVEVQKTGAGTTRDPFCYWRSEQNRQWKRVG